MDKYQVYIHSIPSLRVECDECQFLSWFKFSFLSPKLVALPKIKKIQYAFHKNITAKWNANNLV